MDPRFFARKGYDTDLLILRSLFALNPTTNLPISTNYLLTTDGIGGLVWANSEQYFSSVLGFPNLASTIAFLSTGLSTNTQNISTIFTNLQTFSLSTNTISTAFVGTSTLGLVDIGSGSQQIITASNGSLFINGNAVVPGSGITRDNLVSTVRGLGTAGYVSTQSLQPFFASTVAGLGTAGYVSTSYLFNYTTNAINNLVRTLGNSNYVSSATLQTTVNTLGLQGYISSQQLLSTTESLFQYIAAFPPGAEIISSVTVYGGVVFPSTASIGVLNYFTQDVSTLSTNVGNTLLYNEYGWITSSQLFSSVVGLGGTGLISSGQLASTIEGLGTYGYVSTSQLTSTLEGLATYGYVSSPQLTSTVIGLGTTGYISTPQLLSTSKGLTDYVTIYMNTSVLPPFAASTVAGLGTAGYVSSGQLASTVRGLGTVGYVSTTYLDSYTASLVRTLASSNYVSTATLNNTVATLGTTGYVSSLTLYSTITGLGGAGLVSSGQLTSSLVGLGTLGFISSQSLYSTSIGLQQSFYVVNANNVIVTNSMVSISSVSNIIYLSSILMSSITYQGTNGQIPASNTIPSGQPLYFSSAQLAIDQFSTYITPRAFITIEAYPTFLFSPLGLPANGGVQIFMSTFIQNGRNYLSTFQVTNMFYPLGTGTNNSNQFSPSIKISVPARILSNYFGTGSPIFLSHYLPNAATVGVTQGFTNCNVTIYYGSTNSVFLSVQNLP